MFWRFGGYANISTIDTILDKPDFTLEELLEETDLLQELKQHNTKLIEYLREDNVLERLLAYVVAPKLEPIETPEEPPEDDFKGKPRRLPFSRPRASSRATDSGHANDDDDDWEKKHNRYALVACEVLSSDTWSINEALTENLQLIRNFWKFLSRPAPLDPLQASYFTKVNEALFEKKTEDMMDLLWNLPNAVPDLLKHVECPMIMDLLLKIIALDRNEGGQGVVEWLYSKNTIPTLLSFLSPEHSWVVQTAAGDFIKAIITISANASQNEQQCIGPNELTRQLVSKPCVEQLIGYMLGGGNPLTVGVGIVIEVIRKNNSDYDPEVGPETHSVPSSRDPIYLGTLLRLFAQNVPQFMSLIMNGPSKKQGLDSTFGEKLEPLGFDRFKTCELMAELLHCSNMGLLNEVGAEQLIAARDAERQRLRAEGKLGLRDDDASADDLTMRMLHPAHDEGRRLEVTNADDDGFEEVEPSHDMSDDTSHEFIKAEDDIAAPGPSSLLDKDEDEFVDEPLSSPRLTVGIDRFHEQHFEEPDLVVAPLSPTKAKQTELAPVEELSIVHDVRETQAQSLERGETKPTASGSRPEEPTEATETDVPELTVIESSEVSMADDDASEENQSAPITALVTTIHAGELSPDDSVGEEHFRELSPHPADTPAPLFSAPLAPDSGAQHPPQAALKTLAKTDSEAGAISRAVDVGKPAQAAGGPAQQGGDMSRGAATEAVEPVVGDYLKMQFVEHRVVPAILSFFFAYPWNNFLHNVVYDIVQQVFNGPMDRGYNQHLAVSLFEAADITTAIINGQRASDESQAKTKTRMGYMGHLTLIAEEVVKFTERHPPELLSELVLDKVMSQDWINYVEGALAETRERDNAILGGVRPEVAMVHRSSVAGSGLGGIGLSGLGGNSAGSSALAEAGLNGGIELGETGGNGIGPFAISAGTLMSGFGSSSDEEDEEGDGDEEDVNSEFRAYTDPLNQGSMTPPSIPPPPPPPPPLNIPPSRARLQLAARLAMHHKNNNQTTHASSATLHHNNDDDDDDDNLEDPFGDGDDDHDDIDEDLDEDASSHKFGRGSWWRGAVGRRAGVIEEEDSEDDDDEEFGDFAMAEEEEKGVEDEDDEDDDEPREKVLLKPLAVHPARESSRGLSGLWPFGGSRSDRDKTKAEGEKKEERDVGAPIIGGDSGDKGEAGEGKRAAVEVKEARRRMSIEEDDEEEETDVGTEFGIGMMGRD